MIFLTIHFQIGATILLFSIIFCLSLVFLSLSSLIFQPFSPPINCFPFFSSGFYSECPALKGSFPVFFFCLVANFSLYLGLFSLSFFIIHSILESLFYFFFAVTAFIIDSIQTKQILDKFLPIYTHTMQTGVRIRQMRVHISSQISALERRHKTAAAECHRR